jgi:hypothetical protein
MYRYNIKSLNTERWVLEPPKKKDIVTYYRVSIDRVARRVCQLRSAMVYIYVTILSVPHNLSTILTMYIYKQLATLRLSRF